MGCRGRYKIRSYRGGSECTWRTGLLRSSRCILKPSIRPPSSRDGQFLQIARLPYRWFLPTACSPQLRSNIASSPLAVLALRL